MIDIINGYGFKRNHDNTVLFKLSDLGSVLNIQPYILKEHYYSCVNDDCLAEGEFPIEEISKGELNTYLPCKSVQKLFLSMQHEGFLQEEQIKYFKMLIDKQVDTQGLVSEWFNDFGQYMDGIRKHNPHIPPIIESITKKKR